MATGWQIGKATRVFGGKRYVLKDIRFRQSDSDRSESRLRKQGLLIRVVKTGRVLSHAHLYLIWGREK